MRVLLANTEALMRGGEYQTFALAEGLARNDCEVVLASRAGSALSRKASGSIRCEEFGFEALPVATPLALARLIRRSRAEILHAQTSNAHTHLWLARGLLRAAPPLVVSRRVAFPIGRDWLSFLKYRTGVAHYLPISRAAAESLLARGVNPERMTVVPSGVDVEAFRGAVASPEIARRWGIDDSGCVVGVVAAFEKEKGHRFLLRAAAEVLRESPSTRFILVGEGSLEQALRGEIGSLGIEEAVRCVPLEAPLEEIMPLFDIFVLPSIQEGLSTALMAAMAAGVAVVASETGGIPEVVSPQSGILVPPRDHAALARAIARLVNDESLRKRMGEAGRARSAEFDMDRMVRKTL
ncbi:MAG TPA: glycosyltransferase, partial [Candidatus Bathyarchaeia archaeon]|nr:glycosyltransferase [Candidatus Bathyarchaeia archaeon]